MAFLREHLAQGAAQDLARQHPVADGFHRAVRERFDVVEVGLLLERVVHAVVALAEELLVGEARVVPVVGEADRLGQPVGHQRAGGDDSMHHPAVDHLADHTAHLRDGHGSGERQHDLALRVAHHLEGDGERLSQAASAERGFRHRAQQVGEGLYAIQVQALERLEPVFATVAILAVPGYGGSPDGLGGVRVR